MVSAFFGGFKKKVTWGKGMYWTMGSIMEYNLKKTDFDTSCSLKTNHGNKLRI
jgi:hypothetical protein